MIVRESPKSRASRPAQNWPPKSPHEALLSSPSGRKRLEARRRDVSPSPVKRTKVRPRDGASRSMELEVDGTNDDDEDDDDEEDEDEETLQLKLQAIEAKLKLKKLQRAKERWQESSDVGNSAATSPTKARRTERPKSLIAGSNPDSRRTPEIQVPISPVKRRTPPPQTSPARVTLGIDKGLRAHDISLKRSPASRAKSYNASKMPSSRQESMLSSTRKAGQTSAAAVPPKSFSERLAETKALERQKEERQARNFKARSSGFGIKEHDRVDRRTIVLPLSPKKATGPVTKSKSLQDLAAARDISSNFSTPSTRPSSSHRISSPHKAAEETEAEFDSYSGFHLSKRHLPHNVLTRTLADKESFTLPRLLKTVQGPDYDPPDVEGDYVVFGIIASKSMPHDTKDTHKTSSSGDPDDKPKRSKFMVVKLTDLKWEVDLFLFDTGFEAFWKLTPGTVVAILNPGIMPPRNKASGAFSLKLTSSDDTVLEIGTARDLGFCESIKRDGKECGQWIDARKTQFCEFHIAIQLEKTKAGRMEVNTMSGFNRKKDSRWTFMGGGMGRKQGIQSRDVASTHGLGHLGQNHDVSSHETYYVVGGAGNTAKLLDSDNNAFDRGMSREEWHRKRLAEREKEKELGSRLAKMGGGMGSEYLRQKQPELSNSSTSALGSSLSEHDELRNAATLGLLNKKAIDVSLYAANKRKRPTTSSSNGSQPMGWSGAFKRGLLDESKISDADKPQQKKTRLLLNGKGIRTPGRESLPFVEKTADNDDDDDDLDIILAP